MTKKRVILLAFVAISTGTYAQKIEKDTTIALEEVVVKGPGISQSQLSSPTKVKFQKIESTIDPLQQLGSFANVNLNGGSVRISRRGIPSIDQSSQVNMTFGGAGFSSASLYDPNQARGGEGIDPGSLFIFPVEILGNIGIYSESGSALQTNAGNGKINFQAKFIPNGFQIEYSIRSTVTSPFQFMELQNQYGREWETLNDGTFADVPALDNSWNTTKFSPDIKIRSYNGEMIPYVASKNGPEGIFRDALGLRNCLVVSYGDDVSKARFAYARKDNQLIIPNGKSGQNTLFGQYDRKIGKLQIKTVGAFGTQNTQNNFVTGYSDQNVLSNAFQYGNPMLSYNPKERFQNEDGSQIGIFTPSLDDQSPINSDRIGWVLNKNMPHDFQNNLFLHGSLSYPITSWMDVELLSTRTYQSFTVEMHRAIGSVLTPEYKIRKQAVGSQNIEALIRTHHQIDDITIKGFIGGESTNSYFESSYKATEGGLIEPNVYTLENSINPIYVKDNRFKKINQGLFTGGNMGWKEQLYWDINLRIEKSSALPKSNDIYPYYSTGVCWIPSKMFNLSKTTINLRGNYSVTGLDPDFVLVSQPTKIIGYYEGQAIIKESSILENSNIRPEIRKTWEFGTDIDILKKHQLSITRFHTNSSNQIATIQIDPASGYSKSIENIGGMTTKGWEIEGKTTLYENRNWTITSGISWLTYSNMVNDFAFGADRHIIAWDPFGVGVGFQKNLEGEQIFGRGYKKNAQGNKLISETGEYIPTDDVIPLGKTTPDWIGTWKYKVQYQSWYVQGEVSYSKGGSYYLRSKAIADYNGRTPETAVEGLRENGIILEGVMEDGSPNTINIDAQTYGYQSMVIDERNIVSASRISLSYLSVGTQIHHLNVEVFGQNLLVKVARKGFDPQSIISTSNFQGVESGNLPICRLIGVKIGYVFGITTKKGDKLGEQRVYTRISLY